jgi:hypothetical protein
MKLYNTQSDSVTINEVFNRDSSFYVYDNLPITIAPHDSIEVTIVFEPIEEGFFSDKINFRSATDTLLIARQVFVEGITHLVSVEVEIHKPYNYSLSQNYPNPFNHSTTIYYSIPELSNVVLKVYDVLGNEIVTLVNEEKPLGNYEVGFNTTDLTSGIYLYRIWIGQNTISKKMMLLK